MFFQPTQNNNGSFLTATPYAHRTAYRHTMYMEIERKGWGNMERKRWRDSYSLETKAERINGGVVGLQTEKTVHCTEGTANVEREREGERERKRERN